MTNDPKTQSGWFTNRPELLKDLPPKSLIAVISNGHSLEKKRPFTIRKKDDGKWQSGFTSEALAAGYRCFILPTE